jgi:hypothetical protein
MKRRFRASIYVDIDLEATEDLEKDREIAEKEVQEIVKEISKLDMGIAPDVSNPYIGGIALKTGLTLDREI